MRVSLRDRTISLCKEGTVKCLSGDATPLQSLIVHSKSLLHQVYFNLTLSSKPRILPSVFNF